LPSVATVALLVVDLLNFAASPGMNPANGLREWGAAPAVAGRLEISIELGLVNSREMAGRASTEENEPPAAEPEADEKDEAEERPYCGRPLYGWKGKVAMLTGMRGCEVGEMPVGEKDEVRGKFGLPVQSSGASKAKLGGESSDPLMV
jgi:hypothetical protein